MKRLLALLPATVVLASGVAYAADRYPKGNGPSQRPRGLGEVEHLCSSAG
jgi:hypothetical protein